MYGPRLWGALSVGLLAMCALLFVAAGGGEEGARLSIRATARTSALLLFLIFPASALHRRFRSDTTRWILANRRYLGLSLASSHTLHLVFILSLAAQGTLGEVDSATLYGGGWGYVLMFAMAATSNDASVRALGANWRRLHALGLFTLWVIFMVSYLPAPGRGPVAPVFFGGLVAVALLRWWPARQPAPAHS